GPLVTVAQPNGLGRCVYQRRAIELGSQADRARRGGSGALYPQSALAGLNSSPRGSAPVAPSLAASMARVPRGVGLRTRSGPEGSSLKRCPIGAAGAPGPESRAAIRRPVVGGSTRGARSNASPHAAATLQPAPWLRRSA